MNRLTALFVISTWSLIALSVGSQAAQSQTFTVLPAFTGGEGGATPWAGLTLDKAGILYGTTTEDSWGTVFQLKRTDGSWSLNTLNGFGVNAQDARFPLARVVFGPDGTLYGTTLYGGSGHCSGGCGTVYNLRPPATDCKTVVCPWTRTVLYSFTGDPDGIGPYYVDPVFDHAGNLYGTTEFGGSAGDGAVFKLAPSGGGWTESVIYSFTGDGMEPGSGVIFDGAGNIYGTTAFGGRYDQGTIYQLTPSGSGWNARILYSFQGPDGANPFGALISDRSGNLYGTTSEGGFLGGGTVFRLASSGGSWTLSVLYRLSGINGCGPEGALAMDAAGNLYGTTVCGGANLNGSVFKLTPIDGSWTYSSLHDFTGGSDGGYPISGVTLDANGNVNGTAMYGGGNGKGVVWEITP